MCPIYYDLTELYLRSRGKIKYYGIARVVAEIAYEISLLDPSVQFVVFDSGRRQFFRVKPVFGVAGANGLIDLGLPSRGIPFRVGELKSHHTGLRRTWQRTAASLAKTVNKAMFPDIDNYLEKISLSAGILFSAARPKFISDIARFLEDTGSPVRLSAMIYDMIPLHEELPVPAHFKRSFVHDNAIILKYAQQAVSISHFTDNDIGEAVLQGRMPKPKSRAVVQLCHECRSDGDVADIVLPQQPYFMGVGITMGRKNLNIVLDAILLLLDAGKKPPIFVIAGIDRMRNRKALRESVYARAEPFVHIVSAPSQANLIKLYKNALGTVMASKLEGWGLPLGESLWHGTPAISAPNSSLPEVGRDLAIYFDPDSASELAAIFDRMMNDQPWNDALRARVRAAKPTLRSWKDVAADLLQSLSRLEKASPQSAAA
jgi:glycosyltransferase involved in cell wall biosynthesis